MNIFNFLVKPAYATICNPILNNCSQVTNPQGFASNLIQTVIGIFLFVAVLYFLWYFVMGGYHLISSSGDPKKFESARDQLIHAFIGLAVVFSVFAILKFVGIVFNIPGLEQLKISIPTL